MNSVVGTGMNAKGELVVDRAVANLSADNGIVPLPRGNGVGMFSHYSGANLHKSIKSTAETQTEGQRRQKTWRARRSYLDV